MSAVKRELLYSDYMVSYRCSVCSACVNMLDNYCRNCGEKFTETKLEKVMNESKKTRLE